MPKPTARFAVAAYVPVLHRGYLQFFETNSKAKELYIIGSDLLKKVDYIRKDLRALDPGKAAEAIKASGIFKSVQILSADKISTLDSPNLQILMPDEDVSRVVGGMFKHAKVKYSPVFLRWDRRSLESANKPVKNKKVSSKKADKQFMTRAYAAAASSSDIWRRVGALLIDSKGNEVGLSCNQGQPNAHSPWMEGDPRNVLHQGVGIEVSVFMHAEAALIAKAAKAGIALNGASMYVTTFPCPVCAKLIAHSGIKHLYYSEGYGVLDGERVLDYRGVQLQRVPVDMQDSDPSVWVPYKSN